MRQRHYPPVRLSIRTRLAGTVLENPLELWPKREYLVHPTLRLSHDELPDNVAVAQITYCEAAYKDEVRGLRFRQMEQDIKLFIHERMATGIRLVMSPTKENGLHACTFSGLVRADNVTRYDLASSWIVDERTGNRWIFAVVSNQKPTSAREYLRTMLSNALLVVTEECSEPPPMSVVQQDIEHKKPRYRRQDVAMHEVLVALHDELFR